MTRLILIRHGQSLWNAEGRVQGQRCAGLSTLGRAQARVTAASLASVHRAARLLTSDLARTEATVAPLEHELGVPAERDPRLRERSFGAWEGRLRHDIASDDADRWARFRHGEEVMGDIGGETTRQLIDRVVPLFEELLRSGDEVVIAVTHGGPIWHGLHALLGLPSGSLGGVANTSLTELVSWDAPVEGITPRSGIAIDRYNELGHLPVELRTAWQPRHGRTEVLAQDAERDAERGDDAEAAGTSG